MGLNNSDISHVIELFKSALSSSKDDSYENSLIFFLNSISKPDLSKDAFNGKLNLSASYGTFYPSFAQTGAITLSAVNSIVGGWAMVPIVANGSAINIPASWIKYGGDDISIVSGQTNHLQVYSGNGFIYWTNKVVAP